MFLELNHYKPSKQDKFPNWLFSQHLLIGSRSFPWETGVVGLLGVEQGRPVEVKLGRGTAEGKSGRVDVRS